MNYPLAERLAEELEVKPMVKETTVVAFNDSYGDWTQLEDRDMWDLDKNNFEVQIKLTAENILTNAVLETLDTHEEHPGLWTKHSGTHFTVTNI